MNASRAAVANGNDAGSAAIEVSVLGPALVLIMLAIFEYGLFLFCSANLEAAVRDASRFGTTGSEASGMTREERILQIVEERTLGMLDPANATVRTTVYPSFAAIAAGGGTAGAGTAGDVVLYEIEYVWNSVTPLIDPLLDGVVLTTSVAMRNEAFQ